MNSKINSKNPNFIQDFGKCLKTYRNMGYTLQERIKFAENDVAMMIRDHIANFLKKKGVMTDTKLLYSLSLCRHLAIEIKNDIYVIVYVMELDSNPKYRVGISVYDGRRCKHLNLPDIGYYGEYQIDPRYSGLLCISSESMEMLLGKIQIIKNKIVG